MNKEIQIEGMSCQMCVKHVKNALEDLGVSAEVNLEKNNAVVTSINEVSDETLKNAVEDAGYKVVSIK